MEKQWIVVKTYNKPSQTQNRNLEETTSYIKITKFYNFFSFLLNAFIKQKNDFLIGH